MSQKYNATPTDSVSLIKPAIEQVKTNFLALIYLYFVPAMIVNIALPETFTPTFQLRDDTSAIWPWIMVIGVLWSIVSTVAFYRYQLKTLAGKDMTVGEAYQESLHYVVRLVGLSLLSAILVVGGLILFIVPGLIMLRRLALAPYYLVDRDLSVTDSMRASTRESKPASKKIWTTIGLAIPIIFAGVILGSVFGTKPPVSHIGEFIALPISAIVSYMFVFRYLQTRQAASSVALGSTDPKSAKHAAKVTTKKTAPSNKTNTK